MRSRRSLHALLLTLLLPLVALLGVLTPAVVNADPVVIAEGTLGVFA